MKVIGLTGSIATGKSFVADLFRKRKIKVFSSDFEVSNLLEREEVIEEIKNISELANAVKAKEIDKTTLSRIVFDDIKALKLLEQILHPLVEVEMKNFLYKYKQEKTVLLEIPLLFEKERQVYCNRIISTYCSEVIQKERALRRKNIDINRLNFIIKQQIPSKIKAALTDYLVYTDISYLFTQRQLDQIFTKEDI